jgi:hypothetical protein
VWRQTFLGRNFPSRFLIYQTGDPRNSVRPGLPLKLAMQATPSSRSPPSWKEPPSTSRRASCFSFAGVKQRMVASVVGGSAADSESWAIADLPDNFYDFEAKTAKGEKYPFGDLRSKAVLVVNVASA